MTHGIGFILCCAGINLLLGWICWQASKNLKGANKTRALIAVASGVISFAVNVFMAAFIYFS